MVGFPGIHAIHVGDFLKVNWTLKSPFRKFLTGGYMFLLGWLVRECGENWVVFLVGSSAYFG